MRWIELLSTDKERVERLGPELGVHPLAIEDCLSRNQRAKFEDFENHQFLVWFAFIDSVIYELEFILFPDTVILVTSGPPPKGTSWLEYLRVPLNTLDGNHILYHALDRITDYTAASIRPLFDSIDTFEENILKTPTNPRVLLKLKHKLAKAEFVLSSLSSVVGQWQRFLAPKDDLRWRMRDLWDHCERIHQNLVFHRTQIASAMDTYWGMASKRTNEQIKKLTLIASVFVPLSFWTSFWGMNFETIPFKEKWLFSAALLIMIFSVALIYVTLKRKGFWNKN